MTDPLTPADLDLRGLPYMPLDVLRLRDSDLATSATGEEFRAAVILWCAAWHQVPAASLPNDDRLLTKLAGFGRDVQAWKAVREQALHGFVECSDGRLYHGVIAEKAIEASEKREAYRARTSKATAARHDKRNGQRNDERDEQRNEHQGKGSVREDNKGRGVCDTLTPASANSAEYPAEFEAFWLSYPDNSSSKFEAFEAWGRVPVAQQQQAVSSLPAFIAWTRTQPLDYTMLSARKYLETRRFEKFVEQAERMAKSQLACSKGVYLKSGTPEFEAWDEYRKKTTGKRAPRDARGGWSFPTKLPPSEASAA